MTTDVEERFLKKVNEGKSSSKSDNFMQETITCSKYENS